MDNGGTYFYQVLDMFLLLLIGMGPKIAIVPFLELTQEMAQETRVRAANPMVRVAVGTALFLVLLGWFLMRLLHFTPGAANIAGIASTPDCTAWQPGGIRKQLGVACPY